MEIIIISAIILTSIVVLLVVVGNMLVSGQAKRLTADLQLGKIETIKLEKEVKNTEQSQSKELQDFLKVYKNEKKLMEPVMDSFKEVAKKLQLTIISYDLSFEGLENRNMEVETSSDGTPLLTPVQLNLAGDFFDRTPKFKEELENIAWVHDAQLISLTQKNESTEAEYVIRLKQAELPGLAKQEAKKNE